MSDAQTNEDIMDDSDEGSPVIRELREQLRELKKARKDDLEKLEKYAERDAQARQETAKQLMDAAGFPTLDPSVVLERVEGDVSADSVAAALKSIGLEPRADASQEKVEAPASIPSSEMGQRVAQAAQGGGQSLAEKIAAAQTDAELFAVMQEANLVADHSV